MKSVYKKYIAIAFIGACFLSCDESKETEGISRVTYFPDFTFEGATTILLETGQAFTEPGVTAKEGGTSINVDVSITGNYFAGNVSTVDTAVPDKYSIVYSATNSDGFPGAVGRTVFVASKGNFSDDISGLYTATVVRNGVVAAQYANMRYVIIRKTGGNTYELSDIIAGYYDVGRRFGSAYAGPSSTITVNNLSADDFTFGPSVGIGAFGGVADITEMQVDAANRKIHYKVDWDAGPYTFDINLTQVDF